MRTLAASIFIAIVVFGSDLVHAQASAPAASTAPAADPSAAAGATSTSGDLWRFVWKDNMWWYYQPDESWDYWWNNQWNNYVPGQTLPTRTYANAPSRSSRGYYRGRPRVSVGFGYGSPYGYYGSPYGFGSPYGYGYGRGFGYPYGGWGGYPYGRSGIGLGIGIY